MSENDFRLSGTSYAVLTLLYHLGEATPYDLKRALERSVENFWPVPHTTFYAEPQRLASGGYLSVRQERSGRRRKVYSLTDQGREALLEWAHSPEVGVPQLRDEGTLKIFAGADPRMVFATQREWRANKLRELERYLAGMESLPESEHTTPVKTTLQIGIDYQRMLIEAIDEFLLSLPSDDEEREQG